VPSKKITDFLFSILNAFLSNNADMIFRVVSGGDALIWVSS
jgi:hypothetical protein